MLKFVFLIFSVLMLVNVANAESPRKQSKQPSMLIVVPPVPSGWPITEAQLHKVLNMLVQTGTEIFIKPRTSEYLGLGKNGEKIRARQLAIEDDDSVLYGFALLKDGSGYILDKGPRGGKNIAFHLNANLQIINAVAKNSADEFTILSPAVAEARLREVLAIWAEYVDTLP